MSPPRASSGLAVWPDRISGVFDNRRTWFGLLFSPFGKRISRHLTVGVGAVPALSHGSCHPLSHSIHRPSDECPTGNERWGVASDRLVLAALGHDGNREACTVRDFDGPFWMVPRLIAIVQAAGDLHGGGASARVCMIA